MDDLYKQSYFRFLINWIINAAVATKHVQTTKSDDFSNIELNWQFYASWIFVIQFIKKKQGQTPS